MSARPAAEARRFSTATESLKVGAGGTAIIGGFAADLEGDWTSLEGLCGGH